jgi:hypothetical protein
MLTNNEIAVEQQEVNENEENDWSTSSAFTGYDSAGWRGDNGNDNDSGSV